MFLSRIPPAIVLARDRRWGQSERGVSENRITQPQVKDHWGHQKL